MRTKIVLIGAGSAMFTQGIVSDMIKCSHHRKWHLSLVDVSPDILTSVDRLVRKMIDTRTADIEISSSTDRRDVLPGADFVITSIGVGGRRAWEKDVYIPRKYDIFQPVGDSVAVGGISRSMRMIPAMVAIAKDVKVLCPNAVFFNVSNPMTTICRAIDKAVGIPVYGLCAGTYNVERYLAEFIGAPKEEVTALAVGLNHFTWIYDLKVKGQDAWPLVREKIKGLAAQGAYPSELQQQNVTEFEVQKTQPIFRNSPFCWSLFETYGAFPAVFDSHVTEFFLERFPQGQYQGKVLGIDTFSFEGKIIKGDEIFEHTVQYGSNDEPLPESFFDEIKGEVTNILNIIESVIEDNRSNYTVNVPNRGAVPNLPDYAVLEMTAAYTATGPRPLQAVDFPDVLAATLLKHIAIAEMTVTAALEGSRDLFVEAVMMGGYITDKQQCEKMVDELISGHKQDLPQF